MGLAGGDLLAPGATERYSVALAGVSLNDTVLPSFSLDLQGLTLTGYVDAANHIEVVLANLTDAEVDLAEGTLRVVVLHHA